MIPKCRILIYLPTDFTLGKTWNTRRFGAVCSARLIISQIGSSNELRFEIEIEIGFVNERHPGPIIVAFDHIHMVVCAHGVATWAEVLVTHSKSQKAKKPLRPTCMCQQEVEVGRKLKETAIFAFSCQLRVHDLNGNSDEDCANVERH